MSRYLVGIFLTLAASAALADSVTARSYIVTDMNGRVLLERNADDVRPIASITKLVTSRAASAFDPAQEIEITAEDVKSGMMHTSPLKAGQKYRREQLIELALVSSDNIAAIALGRANNIEHLIAEASAPHEQQTTDVVIEAALTPAEVASAPRTLHIVEASGLNPENVSSARDLAELARQMVTSDLARTSVQPYTQLSDQKRHSTNPLLAAKGWDFHLSKTGFIRSSGGCLVAVVKVANRLLTFVVLGSQDTKTRWKDLYELRKKVDPDDEFSAPGKPKKVVTKVKQRYK